MDSLLKITSLLNFLIYTVVAIFILISQGEFYENHYWFLIAFLGVSIAASNLKPVNDVLVGILFSGLTANLLLVASISTGIKINSATFLIFFGYLCAGCFSVWFFIARNKYQSFNANKWLWCSMSSHSTQAYFGKERWTIIQVSRF